MFAAILMGVLTLMVVIALLVGIASLYDYSIKHRSLGWRAVVLLSAALYLVLIVSMVQDYLGTFR